MISESLSELAPVEPERVCPHRWRVETPNGPNSKGVCGVCSKVKMFANYMNEYGNYSIHEERYGRNG